VRGVRPSNGTRQFGTLISVRQWGKRVPLPFHRHLNQRSKAGSVMPNDFPNMMPRPGIILLGEVRVA